jgi:5-methylcytosine-specific restriction endonuclease McrA
MAKARRRPISRRTVFTVGRWECLYCCHPITMETGQVDHIHPVSRGGSDAAENLAAACTSCNLSKGAKPLDRWNPRLAEDWRAEQVALVRAYQSAVSA